MERDNGFKNYDRVGTLSGEPNVELMDLYKDKTMYAVKIGASSSKLCYVVDQSISSLRLYKHKLLEKMPQIDTVAIWIILDRKTHIEKDGIPDLTKQPILKAQKCFSQITPRKNSGIYSCMMSSPRR